MSEVYDQYPGDPNQYPKGTPQQYPYPSQTFQEYSVGEIIGQSSQKNLTAPLIVTSGVLRCNSYQGVKQAFTDTYNFRALLNGQNNGVRVGWTDNIVNAVVIPVAPQPNMPSWSGMHLFGRYRTEEDLYVASLRFDGLATIKRKIAGVYTTLAELKIPAPKYGTTYKIQFTLNGPNLSYYVNDVKYLSVIDSTFGWGTTGIRIDYTDCYITSLRMTSPKTTREIGSDEEPTEGATEEPTEGVTEEPTEGLNETKEESDDEVDVISYIVGCVKSWLA